MRYLIGFFSLLILVLVTACDQRGAVATNDSEPPPPKYAVELSTVTPLLPRRATHLTVDPSGNLYFVQESENGDDVTFIAGPSDVPRAMALSSASIVAATHAAAGDKGNIRAIAAGPGGEIYFYFLGGGKRDTVACFGRFLARTGALQILADTDQLERATGLGRSIELAEVGVVGSGNSIWLFLRHSDAAAMYRLDVARLPPEGAMSLGQPMTDLPTAEDAVPLTRPDLDLACGPQGSALLSDIWSGAIWKVPPQGNASVLCSIVGLSQSLSLPAVNRDGMIALVAEQGEPIAPHVKERIDPVKIELRYPTLLLIDSAGKITAVPREDLHAPAGFPLYAMQLQQLVYEPTRDSFVGFDAASGQVMRLKLVTKD
jgi:hypothetical protein